MGSNALITAWLLEMPSFEPWPPEPNAPKSQEAFLLVLCNNYCVITIVILKDELFLEILDKIQPAATVVDSNLQRD